MVAIVLNQHKLEDAAASLGIVGRAAIEQHLGLDYSQPVTGEMMATILTRLPIQVGCALFLTTPQ